MSVPSDTPVSAIEGIGEAAEQLLQRRGVYTVDDLLRAPAARLHAAVASIASLAEVRSWRQMAVLLEVDGITPQWAEALVKSDIVSFADLRRLTLSELSERFRSAKDQRVVQDVPTPDETAIMLKDAALLDYAGAITGTVVDRLGNPVPDATVSTGGVSVKTDGRGRFRIRRLTTGGLASVSIEHPSYQRWTESIAPAPTPLVMVHRIRLSTHVSGVTHPGSSTRASELAGDRLPAMQGQAVTSHEVPTSALARQDLLKATFLYADGMHVKLVSKLLDFEDGKFVVHWVKMPLADLRGTPELNDYFVVAGRGLRKVKMSARKLQQYKGFLRVRKALAGRPSPETARERQARVREFLDLLNARST
jgi:uncharacterized protein DUF4332/carboxypeptidase family protein